MHSSFYNKNQTSTSTSETSCIMHHACQNYLAQYSVPYPEFIPIPIKFIPKMVTTIC
jgi:hypothetical protein